MRQVRPEAGTLTRSQRAEGGCMEDGGLSGVMEALPERVPE